MNINKQDVRIFFRYVLPSIFSFALSGIYSIVDGYFIGNRLGDAGLSAVTIVYPIVAFIQAVGTGLGMGGAIYFSIERARGQDKEANRLIAIANWLMLGFSVLLTTLVLFYNAPMLKLLGASGNMLPLAQEYIIIISFGTGLQIFGTGLVPFIRNLGGSSFAMISMVSGFATNIVFDYLFVLVWEQGMTGAALATVLGQGLTMLFALAYLFRKGRFTMKIHLDQVLPATSSVVRVGLAPFGLAMSPNISLMIINRFSASYGGESAIAVYACIAYMISDFSGLGALCRHFTHHHIRLLCVPTGSTLLSIDFYRTCADVGVYANSASAFWWADHDLVVYRICAHLMRSAGVWHGRFCEEKIPDGRKTI